MIDCSPVPNFMTVNRINPDRCRDFVNLGYEYMKEVASDCPLQLHEKFLNSILDRQGEEDRWLILLKLDGDAAGFVHAKIDNDERIGWGYILEFYIAPRFRRKGFGTSLYNFMKQKLMEREISKIWLSADKTAGEPFWFSLGFLDTGERENDQKVLQFTL